MSMARFGSTKGHTNALITVWDRWEAGGGSRDDLNYTHKRLGQHYEVLLNVSDNTTRRKLERPSNPEFLAKAKAATGKEEDARTQWYHMDTF
ncbi:hypothetical protein BD626DRAFT_573513 [Schizophyllum amplum]|uniref:Uncharacterized protein n=1 Tax=Schizophyllum amplum TaxID=97359 RepID=A0A550C193_9AGAR|nr:hypothetical protein BD626DRAFT_573513 [Auriculariopsis ampla]